MSQSIQNSVTKQLPILLKREFWEHKVAIFYVPLIITLFSVGLIALSAISAPLINVDVQDNGSSHQVTIGTSDITMSEFIGPQLQSFANRSMAHRERVFEELYSASSFVLLITLWFVIFFYLQGTLYEDRKDRSILFWKSLPVSDGLTVASKLITALIVIPVIYLAFIIVTQLAFVVIASVVAAAHSVDVWSTLWVPAHLVSRWLGMLAFLFFTVFWCLPLFAWVLLVSSWAKSVPFAWVVGVPILLIVVEGILFRGSNYIREFIGSHSMTVKEITGGFSSFSGANSFTLEMLLAVVIGCVFIALTIWKRGYANEI